MPPILRSLTDSPYHHRIDEVIEAARAVRLRAWARYSRFKVGAALLTYQGQEIFVGTNVESADYDVTHAEESAISAFVTSGTMMVRPPVLIVAVGSVEPHMKEAPFVMPCGKCREKIFEWIRGDSQSDVDVIVPEPTTGKPMLCSIRELLPMPFFDASL